MDTLRNIEMPKNEVAKFCRGNHIRKLSLFGSVLRDDFSPESDVDVLVEFEPNHKPSLFKLSNMELELSKILGGRKVDLRTLEDLSRYFRREVLDSAQIQYARE